MSIRSPGLKPAIDPVRRMHPWLWRCMMRPTSKPFRVDSFASSNPIPLEAPVTSFFDACPISVAPSGTHHHFDAAVFLVAEALIEARPLFQSGAMGDDE